MSCRLNEDTVSVVDVGRSMGDESMQVREGAGGHEDQQVSGESDGDEEEGLVVEENGIEEGKGGGVDASIEWARTKQGDGGDQRHSLSRRLWQGRMRREEAVMSS